MSGYGNNYAQESTMLFKPGINEGVRLSKVEIVELNTAKYQGLAFDVVWNKDGSEIGTRIFPVNPEKVFPREVKGVMQTQEEAVDNTFKNFNSYMKHIATSFDHIQTPAEGDTYEDKAAKVNSFETACKAVINHLPKNFSDYTGKLIVGYDNNGYLNVPTAMWVTGNFWVVDGSDKPMSVSKRIKLTRPNQPQPEDADVEAVDDNDEEW